LDPHDADAEAWAMLAGELPSAPIDLSAPVPAVDAVVAAGLGKSKGEARRLLSQGGITMNGAPLAVDAALAAADVLAGRYLWLRRGKKTDAILIAAAP
jgi:tyrosyl-tRNA synthetase